MKQWICRGFSALKMRPFLIMFIGAILILLCLTPTRPDPRSYLVGCLFWAGVIFLGILAGKPFLHKHCVGSFSLLEKWLVAGILAATILFLTLPMGINPLWNGEQPDHRDQYEQITEAFLQGQLHFLYEPSDELLAMENPYDPEERIRLDVDVRWDHALYEGHYYMYFGVVPVFLAFLPYRLITGAALTTYKATQLFTGLAVVGIFLLFYWISQTYWKKMTFGMYTYLSVAFSVMSFWFASSAPALYCTAITAGICMEVWSLYFFTRAVWSHGQTINKQIFLAFWGAVFGALTFGTRPPIALANLLVIPLLWEFLQKNRICWKLTGKLTLAASPYLVVACLLMLYNYARFDNPFEFGQAYQITFAEQTGYGKADLSSVWMLKWYIGDTLRRSINGLMENFFQYNNLTEEFPHVWWNGVFFNFPFLFIIFRLFWHPLRQQIRNSRAGGFVLTLFLMPIIITIADVLWSPFLTERYRMDIYFLMSILAFFVIGFWNDTMEQSTKTLIFPRAVCILSVVTVVSCIFLFMRPNESELSIANPDMYNTLARILRLGNPLP